MEIKIGSSVRTIVDKYITEGTKNNIFIPKGSEGTVCEIHDNSWVFVEIWGEGAPNGVRGVYSYNLEEIELI